MRFRVRRLIVGAALLLAAGTAAPAAGAVGAPDAVGGPRLASHDVVVDAAAPPLPPVTAAGFVVADLDTGAVLAARDPHGLYAPASTLKTLTALTLLPRLDPAALVTPSRDDVNVDGTRVGLVTELQYPVSELFGALLISSANDAAGALAEAAGGPATTATLMNEQAARLQALDTHAINPSGLDAPGQVSSAYDLALIARAGLARPDFRTYVQTRVASVAAPAGKRIEIDNHNRLLADYPGTIGVKNGYTDLARASYVGAATRDGHTILITLLRSEPALWKDAAALLDWGFAARAAGVPAVGRLVDAVPAAPPSSRPGSTPVAMAPGEQAARLSRSRPAVPVRPFATAAGVGAVALLGSVLVVVRRRGRGA